MQIALQGPDQSSSIAVHVNACLDDFRKVCESLAKPELCNKPELSLETMNDILGQFRLFVGNQGAHREGRGSLDDKLREASHIRDLIIELLQSLRSALQDTLNIITGQRVPWEAMSDSDSDSSDSELQCPEEATTELEQLASTMAETNIGLMQLSISIRNPAPHDQFKESKNLDVTNFEAFDLDHVRSKFPSADGYLVLRLGKAISRRRQYLLYRNIHRQKLEQGLSPKSQDEMESTVASSIPLAAKFGALEVGIAEDDYYKDTQSQTSYTHSTSDTTRLHPPSMPKGGEDGNPFECPLCFRFTSVHQTTAWYKHIYTDLQPYMCTFEDCEAPDRMYESRHDWFQHELQAHRKWWECVDRCNMTFRSLHDFRTHLCHTHNDVAEDRIDSLARISGRQYAMDTEAECFLCHRKLPSLTRLRSHLGGHHEELSLFALPLHMRETEDASDEGKDTDNAHCASSVTSDDVSSSTPDEEGDKQLRDDSNFSPFQPGWTRKLTKQDAVRYVACEDLREREKKAGYMYIFYSTDNPNFVKIGRATNVSRRLIDRNEQCKGHLVEYEQQTGGERLPIRNVSRVERLIFTELKEFRVQETCKGCLGTHFEWFRITPEHAAKVIKKYADWMAKDPYGHITNHTERLSKQAEAELESICNTTEEVE